MLGNTIRLITNDNNSVYLIKLDDNVIRRFDNDIKIRFFSLLLKSVSWWLLLSEYKWIIGLFTSILLKQPNDGHIWFNQDTWYPFFDNLNILLKSASKLMERGKTITFLWQTNAQLGHTDWALFPWFNSLINK